MTTAVLSPLPVQKFFDNNGSPLANGLLFTYQAGTTTKLATYTDSTGGTPNTNPIVLNARGECNLWVPPNVAYKFVLSPSTDTDPPTSPIWTVDQVANFQLATLYGGVDTGVANAYILTFSAAFSSYTDGLFIVWIPTNTNTTASTININGLGVISIVNSDGTALIAGELTSNVPAQILIKGGQAVLLNPYVLSTGGSFTPIWTGFSVNPVSFNVTYKRTGNLVTLFIINGSGTSNATTFTMGGLPASIAGNSLFAFSCPGLLDNNIVQNGSLAYVAGTTVQFWREPTFASNWTNSGTKGFPNQSYTFTYSV